MGRRNLDDGYGASLTFALKLGTKDLWALESLADAWAVSRAEAIRRAIREASARVRAELAAGTGTKASDHPR